MSFLKNLINENKDAIIDKIFDDVNVNNTDFVKNDVEVCKKLKNTGSA